MGKIIHVFLVAPNTKSEKDTRMAEKAHDNGDDTGMMEDKKCAYLNGNAEIM